jgi:hypothetical protein
MRRAAPFISSIVGCVALGCSTLHPSASNHPGVTAPPADSVTRVFPASSTLLSERLVDVMREDPILQDVAMYHDPANRECRNFSKADRQALGISLLTPANDVNFEIKAKCKDGQPVNIAVRLKGESSAEASVHYGFGGDPDLSGDLLDKVEAILTSSTKDAAVAKTAASKASTRDAAAR